MSCFRYRRLAGWLEGNALGVSISLRFDEAFQRLAFDIDNASFVLTKCVEANGAIRFKQQLQHGSCPYQGNHDSTVSTSFVPMFRV